MSARGLAARLIFGKMGGTGPARLAGALDLGRIGAMTDPSHAPADLPEGASRRTVLALGAGLAASGLAAAWPLPALADPAATAAAIEAVLAGRAPVVDGGLIELGLPQIAEDGSNVPLDLAVASPMTTEDHVTALHVFAERNPQPAVATFRLGPANGRAAVSTRLRLAESQDVIALAELSDGTVHLARRTVQVTVGGCS